MHPVNAFRQHRQLDQCEVNPAVPVDRPDKVPPLQPFGEQAKAKAVCVGPEDFHHIAAPATQDKQVAAERISTHRVLHLYGQSVEAAAHVSHTGNQPDKSICRKGNYAATLHDDITRYDGRLHRRVFFPTGALSEKTGAAH